MPQRPSLDEIFSSPASPQAAQRPSLDEIFSSSPQPQNVAPSAANQAVSQPLETAQPNIHPNTPNRPEIQDSSLIGRIGQDVGKRFQQGVTIMTTPGQNPASVGLQMAGKVVAGTAGDILGETAKSAYHALPDKLKQNIESDPIVRAGVFAAEKGAQEYEKFRNSPLARAHPEAVANIEAVGNILGFGIGGKTAGLAGKAITVPTGLESAAKGMAMTGASKLNKITKGMYEASQQTADRITKGGVVLHPNVGSDLISAIDQVTGKITGEQAARAKDALDTLGRFTEQIAAGDTSLKNIFFQRKTLSDLAGKGDETGAVARKALKEFDTVLGDKNLAKKVVGGNPKSAKDIQLFNQQYRQYKSHEKVVDAITPLEGQPELSSNQIRARMAKLADSPDFNYLTPKVQGLVKRAARGKTAGNILGATNALKDLFGKHGAAATLAGGVGAAFMGHPAALGVAGGVLAGSAASRQIAKGTVADILKAIQEGK